MLRHEESIPAVAHTLLQDHSRPTALLVATAADAVNLMTSLMHAGIRFPDDMSLISRDEETFLDYVRPSITRYRCDLLVYARRLAREVIHLATTRTPEPRQIRIAATFQSGDTLGPNLRDR
jgi:LacI family transcriptional regulator